MSPAIAEENSFDEAWQREVEPLLDRFEAGWRDGRPPAFDDLLTLGPDSFRPRLCRELALIDLERRLTTGQPARADEYTQRFPVLAGQAAADLLVTEFAHRPPSDPVGPEEFAARFGHLADRLPRPAPGDINPEIPGYEVLERLGEGGMGVVFKARQLTLDREVALKVLGGPYASPEARLRFESEAALVARLRHPGIVQVYDYGTANGRPFIAMEYVPGGSLAQAARREPQPPGDAAGVVRLLAGAVEYAHGHGVIHRDLKPDNVLLAEDGTPKVADFGLAKRLDAANTVSGAVLGTPGYMAPELAAGDTRHADARTDVYGLGAVLYELLTGRPPFQGVSILDTLQQVQTRDPVPVRRLQPKVPRDLETVCLKCLEKDPRHRYADCAALADDLRRWSDGLPTAARPQSAGERLVRWARRNPALTGLYATLLTAIVGVVVAAFAFQRHQFTQQVAQTANERQIRIGAQVDALGTADFARVSYYVRALKSVQAEADPLMRAKYAAAAPRSPERLRYALALLPADPNRGEELLAYLSSARGGELLALRDALYELAPRDDAITAAAAPADKALTVDLGGVAMHFVRIPAGEFLMGAPDGEAGADANERPQHPVRIANDFYLGKYPVTQEQYRAVVGVNPSWFCTSAGGKDKVVELDTRQFPVEAVSWEDAVVYCVWLWWRDGRRRIFRLPTEAEWEYACRGGTTTAFHFGVQLNGTQANCDGTNPYGTGAKGPNLGRPSRVGAYESMAPHPWGLCDMHGNVWQWCQDRFDEGNYAKSSSVDPLPESGAQAPRFFRGGSWSRSGHECRSANRGHNAPGNHNDDVGFRVCIPNPR